MTRDLSAIIKDYIEAKKMLEKYSNYSCYNESDYLAYNHYESKTEQYTKELEQKVLAIYNGIC